ncbi:MAG TPA: hypothetical protein VF766_14625 [Pyrinomonadaceae bacterium]
MKHLRIMMCSFCMILGWSTISSAQDERTPPLVPEKDYSIEPFDRYDDIPWANEKARLDNFAVALFQDPELIGYIIVYAGRESCLGYAQRRALRAKKYLVERRGVDWNRVIWKDAGYLERPYVMLWGQARGEQPYPFHQPQPLKDVKSRKCRAKAVSH